MFLEYSSTPSLPSPMETPSAEPQSKTQIDVNVAECEEPDCKQTLYAQCEICKKGLCEHHDRIECAEGQVVCCRDCFRKNPDIFLYCYECETRCCNECGELDKGTGRFLCGQHIDCYAAPPTIYLSLPSAHSTQTTKPSNQNSSSKRRKV